MEFELINRPKCIFMEVSVEYLGHVVNATGLHAKLKP